MSHITFAGELLEVLRSKGDRSPGTPDAPTAQPTWHPMITKKDKKARGKVTKGKKVK